MISNFPKRIIATSLWLLLPLVFVPATPTQKILITSEVGTTSMEVSRGGEPFLILEQFDGSPELSEPLLFRFAYVYNSFSFSLVSDKPDDYKVNELGWGGSFFIEHFGWQLWGFKAWDFGIAEVADNGDILKKDPSLGNEYPGMTMDNWGVAMYYLPFGSDVMQALEHGGQDVKSGFNPYIKVAPGYFRFASTPSLAFPEGDSETLYYKKGEYAQINGSLGIAGLYAIGRFFLAGALDVGGGLVLGQWKSESVKRDFAWLPVANIDALLGYKGDVFSFGFGFDNLNQSGFIEDNRLRLTLARGQIYFGFEF